MRNLAIVGLKLLGILGIYWAITSISTLTIAFLTGYQYAANSHSANFRMSFGIWLVISLINTGFAVALMARTDWIVAKLKFPEDPPSSGMAPSQLLRVGFVLLGAYVVIDALPAIGSTVYIYAVSSWMPHPSAPDVGRIIPPALKFILGCILIGNSNRFTRSVFSGCEPAT